MATARALLARVAKIERARAEAHATASLLEAIEIFVEEGLAAGRLDRRDVPVVIIALRQWRLDGFWGRRGLEIPLVGHAGARLSNETLDKHIRCSSGVSLPCS